MRGGREVGREQAAWSMPYQRYKLKICPPPPPPTLRKQVSAGICQSSCHVLEAVCLGGPQPWAFSAEPFSDSVIGFLSQKPLACPAAQLLCYSFPKTLVTPFPTAAYFPPIQACPVLCTVFLLILQCPFSPAEPISLA